MSSTGFGPSAALSARARIVPIEDELARRGVTLKRVTQHERAGPCPVCGGTDRFAVNTAKQIWNCRGCQRGGDVVSLVQHLDGVGFAEACRILAGERAPPLEEDVWQELDALLHQRWRHPAGGQLKVDAAAIDAGSGGHYDVVLRFASSRLSRRVMAIKGAAGARPALQVSKTKKGRLFIVGVDSLKSQILTRLARGRTIRFSNSLEAHYFAQLSSERRVVRVVRGRPTARFERKLGAKAEALDCLVYALAAKSALTLTQSAFSARADQLAAPAAVPVKPRQTVFKSSWVESGPEPW